MAVTHNFYVTIPRVEIMFKIIIFSHQYFEFLFIS